MEAVRWQRQQQRGRGAALTSTRWKVLHAGTQGLHTRGLLWPGAPSSVPLPPQPGRALTTMLLMDTQQSSGKSCSMGTRNCRQPSQWQSRSIMPMRLTIRTTALARS